MSDSNTSRNIRIFHWMAIIAINVLAIFIILNAAIWGYHKVVELKSKSKEAQKTPFRYKHSNEDLQKLFPNFSQEEVDQLISDCRRISQVYDSFTQFKEGPYKTRFVNVDTRGFRLCKNQGPWPPSKNDFVIFFFGGSTSFCYGVPDDQTIASNLQEFLNQKSKKPVRVYNFGRAHYFSSQERVLFEKLLLAGYIPNMAIFLDGLNEFILYDGEPGYTERLKKFMQESDIPVLNGFLRELPLVKFISNYASTPKIESGSSSENPKISTSSDEQKLADQVIQRYLTNKRIIEATSRDFGIATMFFWQPVPVYGYDQSHHIFKNFDYKPCCSHVKRGYEYMASVPGFSEYGDDFIWLADLQRGTKEPNYVSALHYSPKMSRRIAQMISDALLKKNLIPVQ